MAARRIQMPISLIHAAFADMATPLRWGLAGVLALLVLGAAAGLILPLVKPGKDYREMRQRVWSWWVMAALIAGALTAGWQATLVLFAVISFLALREFLSLAPVRREDRLIILLAYLAIIPSYALLFANRYGIYLVFIPVWAFLIVPFLMACIGQTRAYLTTAATFHWGLMTCVFNLGFAAYLSRAPRLEAPAPPARRPSACPLLSTPRDPLTPAPRGLTERASTRSSRCSRVSSRRRRRSLTSPRPARMPRKQRSRAPTTPRC